MQGPREKKMKEQTLFHKTIHTKKEHEPPTYPGWVRALRKDSIFRAYSNKVISNGWMYLTSISSFKFFFSETPCSNISCLSKGTCAVNDSAFTCSCSDDILVHDVKVNIQLISKIWPLIFWWFIHKLILNK